MAELIDLKLLDDLRLSLNQTGDEAVIEDYDVILQDIRLEAMTQEGELFWDEEYGWSLNEYLQVADDELEIMELKEKIREKMEKRTDVDPDSLRVECIFERDVLQVTVSFQFVNDSTEYSVSATADRIHVEVIISG